MEVDIPHGRKDDQGPEEGPEEGKEQGGETIEPGFPFRVGFGYDSHRFDPTRPMILGGVLLPGTPGLAGHSDADAVAHAVTDALLGATADGDIGSHFPPSDDQWKDADSMALLRSVVQRIHTRGWAVGNVDVTLVCERPRVGPAAPAIRRSLAGVLGVPPSAVSVKGKTNETMGWEGRGEGIAVHAVALVHRVDPDQEGASPEGRTARPGAPPTEP